MHFCQTTQLKSKPLHQWFGNAYSKLNGLSRSNIVAFLWMPGRMGMKMQVVLQRRWHPLSSKDRESFWGLGWNYLNSRLKKGEETDSLSTGKSAVYWISDKIQRLSCLCVYKSGHIFCIVFFFIQFQVCFFNL